MLGQGGGGGLKVTKWVKSKRNSTTDLWRQKWVQAPRIRYGVSTISRLLKVKVSKVKEPYNRDCILQKRPIILRRLVIVATPYERCLIQGV